MIINIKGSGMDLTDAIKNYVFDKLGSVAKLIDTEGDSVKADVELGRSTGHQKKGDVFRVELTLFTKGDVFRTTSEEADLYAGIDDMKEQILHELSSMKGKKQNLLRKGQQKVKNFIRGFFK